MPRDDVLVRVRVASRVTLGADATAVRRFGGAGKHRAGVKALFHPAASGTVICERQALTRGVPTSVASTPMSAAHSHWRDRPVEG